MYSYLLYVLSFIRCHSGYSLWIHSSMSLINHIQPVITSPLSPSLMIFYSHVFINIFFYANSSSHLSSHNQSISSSPSPSFISIRLSMLTTEHHTVSCLKTSIFPLSIILCRHFLSLVIIGVSPIQIYDSLFRPFLYRFYRTILR